MGTENVVDNEFTTRAGFYTNQTLNREELREKP